MENSTFAQAFSAILERDGVITGDTAEILRTEYLHRSKEAIDDFLLTEGLVEEEDLLKALSEYYQVPAFDSEGFFFNHMLLRQFPKDFLLRNYMIPLEVLAGGNILTMVVSDPDDEDLLPKVGQHVSYDLQFLVGLAPEIKRAVNTYYEKPLTDTDEYEEDKMEQIEERRALEIAKRRIDRSR